MFGAFSFNFNILFYQNYFSSGDGGCTYTYKWKFRRGGWLILSSKNGNSGGEGTSVKLSPSLVDTHFLELSTLFMSTKNVTAHFFKDRY